MSVRSYILGLSISFGVAWVVLILLPAFKMNEMAPIAYPQENSPTAGIFFPKRTGLVASGAKVYGENGCYVCHTQVIRPTYSGSDLYRDDWSGLKMDPERGDTRRETNRYDYLGENYAQIGMMRIGPDLSNFGRRVEANEASAKDPQAWVTKHLYQPTLNANHWSSKCPPHPYLFEKRPVKGQFPQDSSVLVLENGEVYAPTADGKALISYLLSLKKDHAVPSSLNFAPKEEQ